MSLNRREQPPRRRHEADVQAEAPRRRPSKRVPAGVGAAENGEAAAGDAGLGSRLSGSTRIDTCRFFPGDPRQSSRTRIPIRDAAVNRGVSLRKPPTWAGSCGNVPSSPVSPGVAESGTANKNDTSTNKATAFFLETVTTTSGFLASCLQTVSSIFGFVTFWAIQPGLWTWHLALRGRMLLYYLGRIRQAQ